MSLKPLSSPRRANDKQRNRTASRRAAGLISFCDFSGDRHTRAQSEKRRKSYSCRATKTELEGVKNAHNSISSRLKYEAARAADDINSTRIDSSLSYDLNISITED